MAETHAYFDAAGRLHVKAARISRAGVNRYAERELTPRKGAGCAPISVYRPAEELARAASSFNRLPITNGHSSDIAIGWTGSNAAFDGEHLTVDLLIVDQDAIRQIVSGARRELSASYSFNLTNRGGLAFDGQLYDDKLTDIRGTHVALVSRARAGRTCSIPDITHERQIPMSYVNGATAYGRAFFRQPIALDASSLEQAHEDETVKTIHALCLKKLRPEQLLALAEKITQHLEGKPASPKHPANTGQAMDSANSRNRVLTNPSEIAQLAQKIRVDTTGVQPTKPLPRPNANAVAGFNARYPDARKIKTF